MSPLAIIFLTVFIDLLGFGIIIPLLPFYAESYGASAFMVGLLGTSFSLMQFLFSPVWGRLSDRIGRRPIILLGLAGSCASYLVLALAQSLTVIFVARIVGGIAGGGSGAAIGAAVGAGAGAIVSASGEEHLKVPAETRLQFQLSSAVNIQP